MIGRVRERKMNGSCAESLQNFPCRAANLQTRNAVFVVCDFNVVPRNAPAPAGFQSFQTRFLRGETRGVALRRSRAFRLAVSAFALRKNALDKTRRSFDSFANTVNFNYVYANR